MSWSAKNLKNISLRWFITTSLWKPTGSLVLWPNHRAHMFSSRLSCTWTGLLLGPVQNQNLPSRGPKCAGHLAHRKYTRHSSGHFRKSSLQFWSERELHKPTKCFRFQGTHKHVWGLKIFFLGSHWVKCFSIFFLNSC